MGVKVSVIMLTYNHEKFIDDGIEGVLMQQTHFPFELIVANDHSIDHTEEIIEKYRSQKPAIIKGYNNIKNLGPRYNFIKAYGQTTGEYIAMCEGDDYWTDPQKLQKQVDFLEANKDFVLSFHDIKIIDDAGNSVDDKRQTENNRKDFNKNELLGNYLPTPTLVYRKIFDKLPSAFKRSDNGDAILLAYLTQEGKAKYHNDIKEATIRVHTGGMWSSKDLPYKWTRILKTKFIVYRSLKKNLRKQVFDQYISTYEMASVDADSYQSSRYWYAYNFSYVKFCLYAGRYGKAWLIARRILQKGFTK